MENIKFKKPCPFCKSKDLAFWNYNVDDILDEHISVYCLECKARGPKQRTMAGAIMAWDMRGE
jgi:Lar family restriction alleviation protein